MLSLPAASRKFIRRWFLGLMFCFGGTTALLAQINYIERSAPELIEAGTPLFEVRTYQTLGLDAPPTDQFRCTALDIIYLRQ